MSTKTSHQPAPPTDEFPTKDQAVVVDSFKHIPIKDYARAFGNLINPLDMRFISKISNNRVCLYVSSKEIADDLVDKHKFIKIQDQDIAIRPLVRRNNVNKKIGQIKISAIPGDEGAHPSSVSWNSLPESSKAQRRQQPDKDDIESIDWLSFDSHLSAKVYPLTIAQLKEYLLQSFGTANIKKLTTQYTNDINSVINMLKDLIPHIGSRKLKRRVSRIVEKLSKTVIINL